MLVITGMMPLTKRTAENYRKLDRERGKKPGHNLQKKKKKCQNLLIADTEKIKHFKYFNIL